MMVEKGCASCRKWQEHYYWEHMDVSKIGFFKPMIGDFAKGISIPEKFVKNYKITTEGVDLKAPSGEIWHVCLEKHADKLYLMSGWEVFVKAQKLQENDILIFTCSGSSSFDVLIFEASGCVKVSSLFGPNMRKHFNDMAGQHAERYSLSDSEDTSVPSRLVGSPYNASASKESSGREHDSPKSSSCHVKHEAMDEEGLVGSHHNASTSKISKGREPDSPESNNYHVKHEAMEEEESDDMYADSKYYYSRFANRLTEGEKETILGMVPIRPDSPAFFTVLHKNHRQRRGNSLTIPSGFAADHLEARLHDIILRRPNRKEKWFVKYYYTPYHKCFQNLQFYNFVRENKLCEGDICVFELMKGARRVTMTVHAVRNVNDQFVLVG